MVCTIANIPAVPSTVLISTLKAKSIGVSIAGLVTLAQTSSLLMSSSRTVYTVCARFNIAPGEMKVYWGQENLYNPSS